MNESFAGFARPWLQGAICCSLLLLGACATAPATLPTRPAESQAIGHADSSATTLGRLNARALAAAPAGDSRLRLLPTGREALAARIALADLAERSVDLQYYIWHEDASGTLLAEALWRAAERGVRVRLLLDDWGERPSDEWLARLDCHPAIEVRLFNRVSASGPRMLGMLLEFRRATRRMHNKAIVADNQAAIVGGRNIGNEYFEYEPVFEFGDLDVLAAGPVVAGASEGFDAYWNSSFVTVLGAAPDCAAAFDADLDAPEIRTLRDSLQGYRLHERILDEAWPWRHARMVALHDPPAKADPSDRSAMPGYLDAQLAEAMGEALREVIIVSPYFVPRDAGVAQLLELRSRGVRVLIVTNSLAATDVVAVHSGYARYRKALLEGGVEIHEVRAEPVRPGEVRVERRIGASRSSLHAKLLLVDRRVAFVGSMNIDPRSIALNTENGMVIESEELAGAIARGLEDALPDSAFRLELNDGAIRWVDSRAGDEAPVDTEPGATGWQRLQARLLALLPLEGQL
jgi:cardiolipin synthase C